MSASLNLMTGLYLCETTIDNSVTTSGLTKDRSQDRVLL